jgi:hypothetical protein
MGKEGGVMQLKPGAEASRQQPTAYRVRRIGLGPLSRFGCVLGGLASILPSLMVGWGGMLIVGSIRRLLESWEGAGIHFLGQEIRIDVVSLLHLEPVLRSVQQIDSLSGALVLLLVFAATLLGGLVFLAMGSALGWVYNAIAAVSGGLEVELSESPKR